MNEKIERTRAGQDAARTRWAGEDERAHSLGRAIIDEVLARVGTQSMSRLSRLMYGHPSNRFGEMYKSGRVALVMVSRLATLCGCTLGELLAAANARMEDGR